MSMMKIPEFATLAYDDAPSPAPVEAAPLPVWATPEGIAVAPSPGAEALRDVDPAFLQTQPGLPPAWRALRWVFQDALKARFATDAGRAERARLGAAPLAMVACTAWIQSPCNFTATASPASPKRWA